MFMAKLLPSLNIKRGAGGEFIKAMYSKSASRNAIPAFYYALNFKIAQAGDYIIIIKCDSATVFRNSGLKDPTYPIGPNKIFSYTGNSVQTASGNFQTFFYFFYSTQIKAGNTLSAATEVPVKTAEKPSFIFTDSTFLNQNGIII